MKVKCQQCGKEFEAKRSTSKFCSTKCRVRNHRGTKEIVKCIICGKEFSQSKGGRKYCSDECSEIARLNDEWNRSFTENSYFDAGYDSENYDEDFDGVDYGDY